MKTERQTQTHTNSHTRTRAFVTTHCVFSATKSMLAPMHISMPLFASFNFLFCFLFWNNMSHWFLSLIDCYITNSTKMRDYLYIVDITRTNQIKPPDQPLNKSDYDRGSSKMYPLFPTNASAIRVSLLRCGTARLAGKFTKPSGLHAAFSTWSYIYRRSRITAFSWDTTNKCAFGRICPCESNRRTLYMEITRKEKQTYLSVSCGCHEHGERVTFDNL